MSETDNQGSRDDQVTGSTSQERIPDEFDDVLPRIGWSSPMRVIQSPVVAAQCPVLGVGWVDEDESPVQAPALRRAHRGRAVILPMPAILLMPDWQELIGWSDADGLRPEERLDPEILQQPGGAYGDDDDDMEDTVETVATAEHEDKTVEAAVPRPAIPMPVGQSASPASKSDDDDWPDDDDDTLAELADWLEEDD